MAGQAWNIGIPYPIWKVLPKVCSDKLPGGDCNLGFIYEAGQERLIGIAIPEKRTQVFCTGLDVYDPENAGFIFSGSDSERGSF
jgi:hypothetical protein